MTKNPDITRGSSLIAPVVDDKFELLSVSLRLEGHHEPCCADSTDDLNRINAHVSAAFSIMKHFTEAKRK